MKTIKQLIILIFLINILYAKNSIDNKTINLLVENQIDYNIAKDIQKVANKNMAISINYGTYLELIDRVLTDPKAQFAIVPQDVLLYKRDIQQVENFESNIKMVLPLYDKYIYILTLKESKIKTVQELNRKRVNIDIGKNSISTLAKLIEDRYSIKWKEYHYKSDIAIKKLLNKELDVVIIVEPKNSNTLSQITQEDGKKLNLISPKMGDDYEITYINPSQYLWLEKEVETNIITSLLISYNYQKSQTIQRFNYYLDNISNLIDAITKDITNLRLNGNKYWNIIYPYYYTRVKWSLHTQAKNSILNNMDKSDNFINSIGMKFIKIPKGSFDMGSSDKDLPLDEQPQRKKDIDSFYILSTEVTQKNWTTIMGRNPSYFNKKLLNQNTLSYPVDNINYRDTLKFIDKLNFLEGRGNYRLPKEAEWEYASSDNKNNIDTIAWFSKNSDNKTHQVALKKPNKFGLYDMRGNVWEWCANYYTDNYHNNIKNRDFRVLRGGSFLNLKTNTRSKNRMYNFEDIKRFNNGFRVVYDNSPNMKYTKKYIIKNGDSLSSISYKFYRNRRRWDIIYYANKDVIGRNPSKIYPNIELIIPQIQQVKFEKESIKINQKLSKDGIKLLSGTDFKPFLNPALPYGGMANHIVQEIFRVNKDSDYKIFWNKNFSTHFSMLEKGKVDVGIAWYRPDCTKTNLTKETQRRCRFKFSKPIFETISTLYKKDDNTLNPLSPKDIYNSRICRPKGIYTFDLENQGLINGKTIKLIRPQTKKDCFRLLLENQVDFVAVDKFSGSAIISEMNITNRVSSIETISTLLEMDLIVHSTNPRADKIINKLNKGIIKLIESGRMKEIQMKHLSNFFNNEKNSK